MRNLSSTTIGLLAAMVGCLACNDEGATPSLDVSVDRMAGRDTLPGSTQDAAAEASFLGREDPLFQEVTTNWINKANKVTMDSVWAAADINAKGRNYYFFPAPAAGNTTSRRFDPNSEYFQCWFGMYTVEDSDGGTYAMSTGQPDKLEILALAIADQKTWLQQFAGMKPPPQVSVDTSVPITLTSATVDGRSGWRLSARLLSNVDVGDNNPQSGVPTHLIVPSSLWRETVSSYAPTKLDTIAYIWHSPENKELNVLYYNGVDFADLHAAPHRTLPLIEKELESMAMSVTVHE